MNGHYAKFIYKMVSRFLTRSQNRRMQGSLEDTSDFSKSLELIQHQLKTIEETSILKLIEHISYLSSLKTMTKDLESSFVIIICSLLIYNYSKPLLSDDTQLKSLLNRILSFSSIVCTIYSQPINRTKFTQKVLKKSSALLNSVRDLIKSNKTLYSPDQSIKIKLISKVITMAPYTHFPLILVSLANILTSPVSSTVYPCFTNLNAPFLPSYSHKEYTLVLDLDETLVHLNENRVFIRPGTSDFINEMSQHYELVLFTAATPLYADQILSEIDPLNHIKLRLYRSHTLKTSGTSIKDLGSLGRDLRKVIIIDNLKESFSLHQQNGICIKTWTGDPSDSVLSSLSALLSRIPYSRLSHVFDLIRTFPNNT
jgi:Dullard-like phosphatase family protein